MNAADAIREKWLDPYAELCASPLPKYVLRNDDGFSVATDEKRAVHICRMASGPLSTRVQSLNTFPLVIVTDDEETKSQLHQSTYYRRAVASRDIKLGEVVVKEAPFAWAVREQQSREACHTCAQRLSKDTVEVHGCKTCTRAFYCSRRCQESHAPLHSMECRALVHLNNFAANSGVDIDLVRIAIALCVASSSVAAISSSSASQTQTSTSPATAVKPTSVSDAPFSATAEEALDLTSHVESLSQSDRKKMENVAKLFLSYLPSSCQRSVEDIVIFMCIVNSNAHNLVFTDSEDELGFGLFPLCSIFNHSCIPNCIFTNDGSVTTYRAIRPIQKGEEMCVAYVDLYQSRESRRIELQQSKQFICHCRRCELRPSNEEEKLRFISDKYIKAVFCTQHTESKSFCPGVLVDMIPAPAVTHSMIPSMELSVSLGSVWRCDTCGRREEKTSIDSLNLRAQNALDRAFSVYSSDRHTPSDAKSAFDAFFKEFSSLLHSSHELFFQSYLSLCNCCGALGAYEDKLEHARKALVLAESLFPKYYLPKSKFYLTIANTLAQYISSIPTSATQNTVPLLTERLAALQNLYMNARICCGPQHPRSQAAFALFDRARTKK